MQTGSIILAIAILGAIVFLTVQGKTFFKARPFIKAVMAVALAVLCLAKAPAVLVFMAVGFALSALGDLFLDFPDGKYFLPGLISFFAAHVAYLVYLWPHATWSILICALVGIFTLGFIIWLKPSVDKELVIPVAAYSIVIALMGMAAATTTLSSVLIPIGALLFIASDVVLATEKFKFKFPMDKTINWILYAGGQIALAIGVMSSLPMS